MQSSVNKQDVSQRALSVARVVDRLPPGDYLLVVMKDAVRWKITVLETDSPRQVLELYRPDVPQVKEGE